MYQSIFIATYYGNGSSESLLKFVVLGKQNKHTTSLLYLRGILKVGKHEKQHPDMQNIRAKLLPNTRASGTENPHFMV